MISSRASGTFSGMGLSALRRQLQTDLEKLVIAGKPLVEVILSEDFATGAAAQHSWDDCLRAIDESDIIFVLYNGDSGAPRFAGGLMGICHEEFLHAYDRSSESVRIASLGPMPKPDKMNPSDRLFRESLPRSIIPRVRDYAGLLDQMTTDIRQTILRGFDRGLAIAQTGTHAYGPALDWNRLNFVDRAAAMREALTAALRHSLAGRPAPSAPRPCVLVTVRGRSVLAACHAVPAAMSISEAREFFGQPFLKDFELWPTANAGGAVGPVHIVACHRGVTEAQAIRQLGFPDATIIPQRWGIYVADQTQGIQILFLQECGTAGAVASQVDAATDWLEAVGEQELLLQRAELRAQLIKLVTEAHDRWRGPPTLSS